jgi:hypothetical protein
LEIGADSARAASLADGPALVKRGSGRADGAREDLFTAFRPKALLRMAQLR